MNMLKKTIRPELDVYKRQALQAAMEKIEKSFGKGSIMKMGDDSVEQVEVIPTGSIAVSYTHLDVYKRQMLQVKVIM